MKILLSIILLISYVTSLGQPQFSIATDIAIMRNFSPHQKFWALGQTVLGEFHFNRKESGYAWISYFTPGKFNNKFIATARSPFPNPGVITYNVNGSWDSREVSIGWKHFFIGGFNDDTQLNIYSRIGFGLMFSRAQNTFEPSVDTVLYNLPSAPVEGTHNFKRLTIDLGIGTEYPLGSSFFLYGEIRTWIPTTDYPSPALHSQKNVPMPVIVNAGMRILFSMGY